MAIAGSISPTGGAPRPDPERVATIRYTIVDDAETCAAFGEEARAVLADLNDRTLAETSGAVLDECSLLIARVRDCIADLNPARLEPRRGLGGLFDSRSKRLKAFRVTFLSTAERVAATAADLGGRADGLTARETALEALWSQTRDAIAHLDVHIAAARDWLAQDTASATPVTAGPEIEPDPSPTDAAVGPGSEDAQVEPSTAVSEELDPAPPAAEVPETETDSEIEAEPAASAPAKSEPEPDPTEIEPASEATVSALPHPLLNRIVALEALRAQAIARLPQIRAAQNADWRLPAALRDACDAVQTWCDDWRIGLGLAGKKPKKLRPDGAALRTASVALADRITSAEGELGTAQARRAEIRLAA